MKKKIYSILILSLLLLLLSGCQSRNFDTFLNDCMKLYVSDKLSLHSLVKDPDSFGIDSEEYPSLPDLSKENIEASLQSAKDLLKELDRYPDRALTEEQKITAAILKNDLALSVEMGDKYAYFSTTLGGEGYSSNLLLSLSEYDFQQESDIEDYLSILEELPDYLSQIISYEKARQEAGYYVSERTFNRNVSQVSDFLSTEVNDNILITTFDEKIGACDFLSEEERDRYRASNEDLVADTVYPAYETFGQSLQSEIHPSAILERPCQYENGKDYYSLLLKMRVGTELSPEECEEILMDGLKDCRNSMKQLLEEHTLLYQEYLTSTPSLTESEEILSALKQWTLISFPAIDEIPYSIHSVPDALSYSSATAYYIPPALDDSDNAIYINSIKTETNDLFSVLAHEAYPGHMYQTNYFYGQITHPIRLCLRNNGYDEGWGTYAQMLSYDELSFDDMDEETCDAMKKLYRYNDLMSIYLCSLSDLYVNYENYNESRLSSWLAQYGVEEDYASYLYDKVIEAPTAYLSYSIGYYEFTKLLDKAKEEEHFSLIDFHENVLKYGSCPFYILADFIS